MSFDTFDPSALPRIDQSKLMNGLVVPRPIAWVSTIGSAGVNLAPFSYFNAVAVEPCMVMFSVSVPTGARTGSVKDTLQNLDEIPEFVLHLVDRRLATHMNLSSAELPRGESEFEFSKLTKIASTKVRPPRIAEAGVHMECRVHQMLRLGTVPYRMVIGEVLALHTRKEIINARHHVNQDLHAPIARLGANLYCAPTDRFTLDRPV
jgi:flavin reductase (DIM6/NTAB) family NADH-FMN oxidoreductase RutF